LEICTVILPGTGIKKLSASEIRRMSFIGIKQQ